MRPYPGTFNFYDTTLGIWEKPTNLDGVYDEGFRREVLTPLRLFLRGRGWTVEHDPDGLKHYQCIAKYMWVAHYGHLQLKLQQGGRHIEMAFWQDVVVEHPNGGQYDSNRFDKMPYLIRLRWIVEVRALLEYLRSTHGYAMPELAKGPTLELQIARTARYGHKTRPTEHPLGAFNDSWDGEWDKKRGTHRFERDETGWPSEKELRSWSYNGITPGCVRYWVEYHGHVLRGRAYPNMNGMCVFVYGPGMLDYTQCGAGELFVPGDRESLKKMKEYRAIPALKRKLAEAVKAEHFEKAIIFRDLLIKMGARA